MKKEADLGKLIQAILNGETKRSIELSERLIDSGISIDRLIREGLTAALRSLDAKWKSSIFLR